jgi:hypothetical protein
MMAPGFKPVAWVGAVAGAALGCYMLSLNVAAERAELARIERRIIATKQEIRALQTELGTRGRLAQLEEWNADVLALAAPASAQFLDSEVKLARFDHRAPTIEQRARVQMAAADTAGTDTDKVAAPVIQAAAPAVVAVPAQTGLPAQSLVRRASLEMPPSSFAAKPRKPADETVAAKPQKRIDEALVRDIGAAARMEAASGAR